jgi:hypothetical protein
VLSFAAHDAGPCRSGTALGNSLVLSHTALHVGDIGGAVRQAQRCVVVGICCSDATGRPFHVLFRLHLFARNRAGVAYLLEQLLLVPIR